MGQSPSLTRYFEYPPYYFIVDIVSSRYQYPSQNPTSSHPLASSDSLVGVVLLQFPKADWDAGCYVGDHLMRTLDETRDSLSYPSPPLASLPF